MNFLRFFGDFLGEVGGGGRDVMFWWFFGRVGVWGVGVREVGGWGFVSGWSLGFVVGGWLVCGCFELELKAWEVALGVLWSWLGLRQK